MVQPALGILALLALAWLVSEDRRRVNPLAIILGLAVTFSMSLLLLKVPAARYIFEALSKGVSLIEASTRAGTSFVFGYLGGGPLPFDEKGHGSGFVLALQALPVVLVVSAITSILFYWRILPVIVAGFAWLFRKTMRIGGAVGLSAAANIFLGMVEAPLFVKPYLAQMTRSELFMTMSCGMAGIAGTVMVLYAAILRPVLPDAIGHILVVSIISVPAALMLSQIMIPETGKRTAGDISPPQPATSTMDAITRGTIEGVALLINICCMLIVLVALVHMANGVLGFLPHFGGEAITLQRLLGYVMAPLAWLIGIPWSEAKVAGSLLGTKTILNEFIAYIDLAKLPPGTLSEKSRLIMVYALCGFANVGSLGIMIGGMGTMAPERRPEIVQLGIKSIVCGTLATCLTGAVVAIIM